jgi:hypothetical protein
MAVKWTDIVTLLFSGAGLTLGVLNWLKLSVLDTRTRLLIFPKAAQQIEGGYYGLKVDPLSQHRLPKLLSTDTDKTLCIAIEVINHSSFPIYIDEVGLIEMKNHKSPRAVISLNGEVIPRGQMPYKLDSKQSATFYGMPGSLYDVLRWDGVYVETSHGYRSVRKVGLLKGILARQ